MNTTEILEMLNGCEVMSWEHEGTVLIKGKFGFMDGTKFELTDKDVEILWEAHKESEGIF
jgi:hypothetical protein